MTGEVVRRSGIGSGEVKDEVDEAMVALQRSGTACNGTCWRVADGSMIPRAPVAEAHPFSAGPGWLDNVTLFVG